MSGLGSVMAQLFRPGAIHLTSGQRGGGKTFSAVAICENLVKGRWPECGKVILLTNVIFVKKVRGKDPVRECPIGVHQIRSLKDIFPIIADGIEEHGRKNVTFVLLLDEAQSFLAGEQNFERLTQDIKKFAGIIRKFNVCLWCITPVTTNIGPSFRNFINDPKNAGNVTAKWSKNEKRIANFINSKHVKIDPRDIIIESDIYSDIPRFIQVPKSTWTKDPEKMAVGEYAYDTGSNATFEVGDGFDFTEFIKVTSGVSSYEIVPTIRQFYQKEKEQEEDTPNEKIEKANRMYLYHHGLGIQWSDITKIENMAERTCREWIERYCTLSSSDLTALSRYRRMKTEAPKELPPVKEDSRATGERQDEVSTHDICISLNGSSEGGSGVEPPPAEAGE